MFELSANAEGLKFRLQARWARNMLKPRDFAFGPANNPFPVYWIILDGSREVEIAGERYTVGPGDFVVYPPGVPYQLPPAGSGGLFHYLSLGCEAKIGPFGLYELYPLPVISRPAHREALKALTELWLQLIARFDELADQLQSQGKTNPDSLLPDPAMSVQVLRLQETLHRWFAELFMLLKPRMPKQTVEMDRRIVKACVYIRENCHRTIQTDDLAAHVYLSPSHFNYLFRRSLGVPPAEYLRSYRIQLAKELLTQTSMPIHEIAARVGYVGQSQFSRAFRKAERKSPLEYRMEWQRSEPE